MSQGTSFSQLTYDIENYYSKKSIDKDAPISQKPIFIVPEGYDLNLTMEYLKYLKIYNINFPDDYKLVGSFENRNLNLKFNVYSPVN